MKLTDNESDSCMRVSVYIYVCVCAPVRVRTDRPAHISRARRPGDGASRDTRGDEARARRGRGEKSGGSERMLPNHVRVYMPPDTRDAT